MPQQQIVSQSSTSPQISPADRWSLTEAKNSLVGNDCTRPLLPEVRDRLSRFLLDTESYAAPASDSDIDDEISILMISFRSARTISAAEAEATVFAYMDALRELPLWAIHGGLRKVRLGEVEGVSRDYPPDRWEITKVLAARPAPASLPTAAKRAENLAKSALNPMQQKHGANYGLGQVAPADSAGSPELQSKGWKEVVEHYQQFGVSHLIGARRPPPVSTASDGGDGYDAMRR
jgi:hypothetical protein